MSMDMPSVRVPGSRRYRAVSKGLREVARSVEASAVSVEAAQRIADTANATGRGAYDVQPTTVRAGWANEPRAGAAVREVRRDWRDVRDRILVNAVQQNTVGR